jgi:hypothetical protein
LGCVIYDAVSISEVIKYYYCAALIWRAWGIPQGSNWFHT